MGYLLRTSQGVSELVSIPDVGAASNVWSFYLDFKISEIGAGSDAGYLLSTSGGSVSRVIFFDDAAGDYVIRLRIGTNYDFDVSGIDFTQRTKAEFISDGTDISLKINGVLHQTFTGGARTITSVFNRILEGPNSTAIAYDIYEVYFNSGFTQERLYDASASGGTGSTLTDTINAQNGTLTGFPTDDSQWVFYSTGAAGPETPINPSITDLLATSARLNWEQG